MERVIKEVSTSIYTALTKILADPASGNLSRRLAENLTQSIGDELKRGQTVVRVESLLYDLLEEVKVTYSNQEI